MGFWRTLYYFIGWEYVSKNDIWCERQQRLKYLQTEQIKKTNNINKILKEEGEIKEKGEIKEINNEIVLKNFDKSVSFSSRDELINELEKKFEKMEMPKKFIKKSLKKKKKSKK